MRAPKCEHLRPSSPVSFSKEIEQKGKNKCSISTIWHMQESVPGASSALLSWEAPARRHDRMVGLNIPVSHGGSPREARVHRGFK